MASGQVIKPSKKAEEVFKRWLINNGFEENFSGDLTFVITPKTVTVVNKSGKKQAIGVEGIKNIINTLKDKEKNSEKFTIQTSGNNKIMQISAAVLGEDYLAYRRELGQMSNILGTALENMCYNLLTQWASGVGATNTGITFTSENKGSITAIPNLSAADMKILTDAANELVSFVANEVGGGNITNIQRTSDSDPSGDLFIEWLDDQNQSHSQYIECKWTGEQASRMKWFELKDISYFKQGLLSYAKDQATKGETLTDYSTSYWNPSSRRINEDTWVTNMVDFAMSNYTAFLANGDITAELNYFLSKGAHGQRLKKGTNAKPIIRAFRGKSSGDNATYELIADTTKVGSNLKNISAERKGTTKYYYGNSDLGNKFTLGELYFSTADLRKYSLAKGEKESEPTSEDQKGVTTFFWIYNKLFNNITN